MSVHTEWASAASCAPQVIAPGDYTDAYGSTNDTHAIVLGDDSVFVIEGTVAELTTLAEQITAAVAAVRGTGEGQ